MSEDTTKLMLEKIFAASDYEFTVSLGEMKATGEKVNVLIVHTQVMRLHFIMDEEGKNLKIMNLLSTGPIPLFPDQPEVISVEKAAKE